uniref:natriuretic peptides A n=1 Tax=Scatophagus argus TaxID=75038 RepID=UPI001ED7FEB9|nr:natriuretic peptides A [Scatophagus argus]
MRTAVLWGLLVLLCQHALVSSHTLGRPSSTSDLSQLKSLLEHFEETLAEAAQDVDSEADYVTDQEPESSQVSRGWSLDQEGDHEPFISERSQSRAEGRSRNISEKNRLQDLLMSTRKRASSCFGARMDRIGNASGLGCNNGRG